MKLARMIDPRLVSFGFEAETKEDVLRGLGQLMYEAGKVKNPEAYIQGLFRREEEFSTGIGNGIAIPHCKDDCVTDAAFTLVRLAHPIDWGETLDGENVDYVIMLAAPNTTDNLHLRMLSRLAENLMDDDFRDGLKNATDMSQINHIFNSIKEED